MAALPWQQGKRLLGAGQRGRTWTRNAAPELESIQLGLIDEHSQHLFPIHCAILSRGKSWGARRDGLPHVTVKKAGYWECLLFWEQVTSKEGELSFFSERKAGQLLLERLWWPDGEGAFQRDEAWKFGRFFLRAGA